MTTGRSSGVLHRTLLAKSGVADRIQDVLEGILNISSEGIVVLDAGLNIVVYSRGAEAIFGYQAREVLGHPLDRLIPHSSHARHRQHVEAFAAGDVTSRRMNARGQIVGRRKSGEVFPIEVGLSKISTHQGLIFTAIVRDVSQRREAEAALARSAAEARAANDAKSAFLAAMSHEIRTPLNGVIAMAQAMEMEALPDHQRQRLAVIRNSGESLLETLNDLLDLSKIETGKMSLEDVEFDLEELMRHAQSTFAAMAANKGLEFGLVVEPAARAVYRGDPLRIRQILNNLISNALKFTERGEVRVCVGRRGRTLTISVRDTGIGISKTVAARLFRPFEQADLSTTRRFGGTGLGLAICADLARMMGGSISVESSPHKGALFTVKLPLPRSRRKSEVRTGRPALRTSDDLKGMRVLVAEDNPMNQLVLQTLLAQVGIEPLIVGDGRAAVDAWAKGSWDLVLMDVQMPVMDGPTAASVIRRRETAEGRSRTAIVALTANAMAHQLAEYRASGMDAVVPKPIQIALLYSVLDRVRAEDFQSATTLEAGT